MFGDTLIYDTQRQVTELKIVIRNKFKHSRNYVSSGYLQVLKDLNKNCRGNLVKLYFSDAKGQLTP